MLGNFIGSYFDENGNFSIEGIYLTTLQQYAMSKLPEKERNTMKELMLELSNRLIDTLTGEGQIVDVDQYHKNIEEYDEINKMQSELFEENFLGKDIKAMNEFELNTIKKKFNETFLRAVDSDGD